MWTTSCCGALAQWLEHVPGTKDPRQFVAGEIQEIEQAAVLSCGVYAETVPVWTKLYERVCGGCPGPERSRIRTCTEGDGAEAQVKPSLKPRTQYVELKWPDRPLQSRYGLQRAAGGPIVGGEEDGSIGGLGSDGDIDDGSVSGSDSEPEGETRSREPVDPSEEVRVQRGPDVT